MCIYGEKNSGDYKSIEYAYVGSDAECPIRDAPVLVIIMASHSNSLNFKVAIIWWHVVITL